MGFVVSFLLCGAIHLLMRLQSPLVVMDPMSPLVYARIPVQHLVNYISKSKKLRESYKRL
jgi:hypothetical protein